MGDQIFEQLKGLTTSQKLVWLYLDLGGMGRYSVRSIANDLELSTATVTTALRELVEIDLLEIVSPGSGQRPATLRTRPLIAEFGGSALGRSRP